MKSKCLNLLIVLFLINFSVYAQNKKNDKLNELFNLMQGHYSSEKQSLADSTYFNISLRMVPIWKDKGHYLYVEQAIFSNQEKPYRVRIYKLSQNNKDEFISEVYTLKDEKEWIGKWKTPDSFAKLSLNDIELKQGCEVILHRKSKNNFEGETGKKSCSSELRGASYATSKVTILPNQIISWDQGFDTNDKQVWGAVQGGYVFDKIE